MSMMKNLNQKGVSLIAVIVLILVLGMVSAAMVSMVNTESLTALHQSGNAEALYAAQAGIEKAMYQYRNGSTCPQLNTANTLAPGKSFTTTGTVFNPLVPTTLAANITNAATTIPLVSSAGYAPHGRVRIETEEIEYASISGNNLLGARRASAGTAAAAHLAGRTVVQNQCLIQSTGTITGPVANSRRVLETDMMGESSQFKGFQKSTTSVTGVGFQPKAVIFFFTKQAAAGFTNYVNAGVGFVDSALNQRVVSITARDGQNRSDNGRRRSDTRAIMFLSGGGPPTLAAEARVTSLDPDGFTLNWTTDDGGNYLIHSLVLGGDITNTYAGTFNLTTGGGNQAVNGVGFQPDFVLFLWSHTEAVNTNTANSEIGLGFAKSSTARGAIVYSGPDNNGSNANKRWQQRTDSVILLLRPDQSPPSQDAIADFVSMNPDGFTINKSNAPNANTPIFFLAMKGGRHHVGSFNQPAATGNQAITGVGFQPQQLMLASFNLAATNAISAGGAVSYGAARSSTARGSIWFQDRSDRDPSEANVYTSTTDILTLATGPNTVNARADFVSFDPGGFTLNWTAAGGAARQVLYWTVGSNIDLGAVGMDVQKIGWQDVY